MSARAHDGGICSALLAHIHRVREVGQAGAVFGNLNGWCRALDAELFRPMWRGWDGSPSRDVVSQQGLVEWLVRVVWLDMLTLFRMALNFGRLEKEAACLAATQIPHALSL